MPSTDFIPPTVAAVAAFRIAVSKAYDVYGTAMTVAGEAHFAALKAGGVSLEVASATADAAFDAAEEAANGVFNRSVEVAGVVLIATKDAK